MATSPKRATKPSKAGKSAKASASAKRVVAAKATRPTKAGKPAGRVSSVTQSAKAAFDRAFWLRTRFVFYIVLLAAVLIATSVGIMTYRESSASTTVVGSSVGGEFYLQSTAQKTSHKAGDTVEATLYENSGSVEVNALQAGVRYPAEQLELVKVSDGTAFVQDAATDTATSGLVRVARSIKPGTSSIKGSNVVVTISFKVLADSPDPFELSIDDSTSLLVRSSDSKNILNIPSTKYSL